MQSRCGKQIPSTRNPYVTAIYRHLLESCGACAETDWLDPQPLPASRILVQLGKHDCLQSTSTDLDMHALNLTAPFTEIDDSTDCFRKVAAFRSRDCPEQVIIISNFLCFRVHYLKPLGHGLRTLLSTIPYWARYPTVLITGY